MLFLLTVFKRKFLLFSAALGEADARDITVLTGMFFTVDDTTCWYYLVGDMTVDVVLRWGVYFEALVDPMLQK